MRRIGWILGFSMVAAAQTPEVANMATPPALPFLDWGACPFEGCVYRQWTAQQPVTIYDTWKNERQEIGRLAKGDAVTALTGVVITYQPGVIRVDREMPKLGLKRGDAVLTYAYRGEGFSAVWFKGRYYKQYDLGFARLPGDSKATAATATFVNWGDKVWWVEIQLKSGRHGWVNMGGVNRMGEIHLLFDGVDLLS